MKKLGIYFVACVLVACLLAGCEDDESRQEDKTVCWEDDTEYTGRYNSVTFRAGQIPDIKSIAGSANVVGFMGGGIIDHQTGDIYILTGTEAILKTTKDFLSLDTTGTLPAGEFFSHNSPYDIPQAAFFDDGKIFVQQLGRIVSFSPHGNDFDTVYTTDYNAQGFPQLLDTLGSRGMTKTENADELYWATRTKIWMGSIAGNKKPELVLDLTDTLYGEISDLLLWKSNFYIATTKGLWKAGVTGVNKPEQIFQTETTPRKNVISVAVDRSRDELYWFCSFPPEGAAPITDREFLYRGNIDGTAAEKMLENRSGRLLDVY